MECKGPSELEIDELVVRGITDLEQNCHQNDRKSDSNPAPGRDKLHGIPGCRPQAGQDGRKGDSSPLERLTEWRETDQAFIDPQGRIETRSAKQHPCEHDEQHRQRPARDGWHVKSGPAPENASSKPETMRDAPDDEGHAGTMPETSQR